MLVSTFTKMIEKRGMHWERWDTLMDRYIKVYGKYQCKSEKVSLRNIDLMGWFGAWLLLRSIQKDDTFEADYTGVLEAIKLAREEYRAAGMPYGDSQEGMLQWVKEQAQEDTREEGARKEKES